VTPGRTTMIPTQHCHPEAPPFGADPCTLPAPPIHKFRIRARLQSCRKASKKFRLQPLRESRLKRTKFIFTDYDVRRNV